MSLAAIMMLSMVNVAAVVTFPRLSRVRHMPLEALQVTCLLYTSDAADE